MKNTKKLTAMMLSGAMALSLSLSLVSPLAAFADDPPSPSIAITINDTASHTFAGYQILKGTLAESGELCDIDWGDNVDSAALLTALKGNDLFKDSDDKNVFADVDSPTKFAKVIGEFTDDSVQAFELAKIINEKVKGTSISIPNVKDATTGNATNVYKTTGTIEAGYYLVVETALPSGGTGTDKVVKSRQLLNVIGTTEVTPKYKKPTLEKNIVETKGTEENLVEANIAGVGDVVDFRLTSEVPDMAGFSQYYYIIEDTLSEGLTFNKTEVTGTEANPDYASDVDIYIGEVKDANKLSPTTTTGTLTVKNYSVYVDEDDTTGKTKVTIVFRDFYENYLDNIGDAITVNYSATVNEDADFTMEGNSNKANLIYSDDPYYKGRGDGKDDGEGSENDADDPDDPGSDDTGKGGGTDGPGSGDDKDIPGEYGGSGTKTGEEDYVSESAKIETKTYLTAIKIKKVDENNLTLTGAEFSITGMSSGKVLVSGTEFVEDTNGEYYLVGTNEYSKTKPEGWKEGDKKYKKVYVYTEKTNDGTTIAAKAFVDNEGNLIFAGLGNGTYTISETTVPTGYNKINDITVNISGTFDAQNAPIWSNDATSGASYIDGYYNLTIQNQKGSTLPTTGGIGTTIFYVVGGLLVSASAIFIITKKRTSNAVE